MTEGLTPRVLAAALLLAFAAVADAATIAKDNNNNNLNKSNSWANNKVPSSADIALWGSGVTGANTAAIGGNLSWLGIEITSPGGLVTINGTAGRTLTLGTGGINMSAATQSLNLNAAVMLGAGQTWDVAANRMITATGVIGGAGRLTKAGAGTLRLSGANTFSGGLVINAGAVQFSSAANLGTSTGWVAVTGGTLQLLTGNSVTTARSHYLGGTTSTLQVDSGATLTLTGTLANATAAGGSLVKTGAGTLVLSAPAGTTYGGAGHTTAINGGTLQVASDNLLGNAANTLSFNGGTLQLAGGFASSRSVVLNGAGTINTNGNAANFAGSFSGSGSLIKSGAGTLSVTAANTHTGGTTINAGTLQVNNTSGSGTGSGAVTVNSGGTLSGLPGAGAFTSPGAIAGNVTVNSGGAVTARSGGTFTFGGLTLNASSLTNFQLATPNSTAIINITGINGLSLAGSSTVNLSNIGGLAAGTYRLFDYTGTALANLNNLALGSTPGGGFTYSLSNNQTNTSIDLIVSASNQQWGHDIDGNWGTASNWTDNTVPNSVGAQANFFGLINQARTVTVDGAFTAGSITFDSLHSYTVAGSGVSGQGITLNNSSGGTAVISVLRGAHTISAPLTLANNLQISANSGTALTLSGVVNGSGAGWTLNSDGSGSVTFSGAGANTFTGLTTVAAGNLNLAKTAGVNALGTGGAEVKTGATISLLASNQIADTASLHVDGTFALGSASETIGALRGAGSVTSGAGSTLTIGASNNLDSQFDGTISGSGALVKAGTGTLTLNGSNSYTGGTTVTGGTLGITSSTTLGHASGTLTIGNATVQVVSDVTSTRNIVLTSASSKINADAGATYTLAGTLSGTGALNKNGDGTLVLSGTNTYTGGSTVNAGTVVVNSANSLGNSSSAVNLNAATLQVASGFTTSRSIVLGSAQSAVHVNAAQTYNVGGVISGAGTLNKTGTGSMTLTSANTFTGETIIEAGTLIAGATSGSALGATTAVTVNNGGTLLLGASNQVNNAAPVSLAGGTIAKGNFSEGSVGTTNAPGFGALTLAETGSRLDFGSGTVGALVFASFNPDTYKLTIDNWTGTANRAGSATTDRLIFQTSLSTTTLATFSFTGYQDGATQFQLSNGYYEITPITPVPEPSTYAAAALALLAVGWQQRRRIRSLLRRKAA